MAPLFTSRRRLDSLLFLFLLATAPGLVASTAPTESSPLGEPASAEEPAQLQPAEPGSSAENDSSRADGPEVAQILENHQLPAVGAVSGPLGLCLGTVVAPHWVVTTKSCVLAVTRQHADLVQRMQQLYFVSGTDHLLNLPANHIEAIHHESFAAERAMAREAVARRQLRRPSDRLVLLKLHRAIDKVVPVTISSSVTTALYKKPELYSVSHSVFGPTQNNEAFGPRALHKEHIAQHHPAALVTTSTPGSQRYEADLGAPLLALSPEGRWELLGALAGTYQRDDDAPWLSSWGHLNVGGPETSRRFVRCDAAESQLWELQYKVDLRHLGANDAAQSEKEDLEQMRALLLEGDCAAGPASKG